jgi:hypothetical protein
MEITLSDAAMSKSPNKCTLDLDNDDDGITEKVIVGEGEQRERGVRKLLPY